MKQPHGTAAGGGPGSRRPSPAAAAFAWAGAAAFALSLAYFAYAYLVRFGEPVPRATWVRPAAIDALLFSVFALHHSVFARTRLKSWVRDHTSPWLERSIYTWISSVLFVAVCWLWLPVPGELYRLTGWWRWIGLAAQLAGIVLTILGARALDVLELAGVRPLLGTAQGHARATPLVTSGAFGLVRHPLYFGWALFVFGAPSMTATRATFAIVSTVYLAIAIPWEERSLIATFGQDYERYRKNVRWRMVPWIY